MKQWMAALLRNQRMHVALVDIPVGGMLGGILVSRWQATAAPRTTLLTLASPTVTAQPTQTADGIPPTYGSFTAAKLPSPKATATATSMAATRQRGTTS